MRLLINGKEQNFEDETNLAQLVEPLGMKADRAAVELNREIVSRAQWSDTQLKAAIGWRSCTSLAADSGYWLARCLHSIG